jgi:bla regulator protein BlaR1
MTTELIVNHLWQSSCFVLLAALLAFALRKNPPTLRYWVWLSASLKFLAPWALLASLGSAIPWAAQRAVSVPAPVITNTLIQIAEPFSPASYSTVPARASTHWPAIAIGIVWALGFIAILLVRCRSWFRIRAALRAGTPVELPIPIPAVIAPGAAEPGIVGFLRPVLVLPAGMLELLNPQQLEAVLAHEMCHVRRRDNLFAAVHMVVEAIFWFHPLVWWIGSRMVEERELACDEEVLRMGCEPTDYVEGLPALHGISIALRFGSNRRRCQEASPRHPGRKHRPRVDRRKEIRLGGNRTGDARGAYRYRRAICARDTGSGPRRLPTAV